MNSLGTRIALVALALSLASASPALAETELVPPGNSAANQYTEAFPTARGGQDPEQNEGKPRQGSSLRALGARNVRRLEAQGAEGRAAAEVAAETAPITLDETDSAPEPAPQEPRRKAKPAAKDKPHHKAEEQPAEETEAVVAVTTADVDPPDGASGLGEVIGQATGLSASGGLGLWLPLILVAVLAWAAGYAGSTRGASQRPG